MKLSQTGVGAVAVSRRLYPGASAKLFVQADVTGTATFTVEGRASPEAPWTSVIASGSVDVNQLIDWRPELRLNVTAGTGSVVLYIAEAVQ